VTPVFANFLFEAANFLVLAAALGWLLFKPVRAALDAERGRYAQLEGQVSALREEAEKREREAREAHAKLAGELEEQRAAVLGAAESDALRIRDEARRSQADHLRSLQRNSEAARRAQSVELADTLGRIAAASLRRLLDAFDGPSLDAALLRAASKQIGELPLAARRAAVVESARPLDDAGRAALRALLDGDFVERVAPDLGAGIRVTTPQGQVDGSALALAREMAREVGEASTLPRDVDTQQRSGDG